MILKQNYALFNDKNKFIILKDILFKIKDFIM